MMITKLLIKNNKLIKESKKEPKTDTINSMGPGVQLDAYHFENFINAIRDGKPLNSPITEGHKSVLLCHLGNISQRVGRALHCDANNGGKILNDKEAQALWRQKYEAGWRPKIEA